MSHPAQLFLDTEFTGLHQQATLISLALYQDEESYFYAEFTGIDAQSLSEWLQQHVISKLDYNNETTFYQKESGVTRIKDTPERITSELKAWLQPFTLVEIWADVLAYDWVLFCQLFGGAMQIPSNIFYAPFDLATALMLHGAIKPAGQYEGDVSRFDFAGMDKAKQHHALEDCRAEKACWDKIKTD